jgi:hypothetical protein
MCFLCTARGFGWHGPNIPTKAAESLPDTSLPKKLPFHTQHQLA